MHNQQQHQYDEDDEDNDYIDDDGYAEAHVMVPRRAQRAYAPASRADAYARPMSRYQPQPYRPTAPRRTYSRAASPRARSVRSTRAHRPGAAPLFGLLVCLVFGAAIGVACHKRAQQQSEQEPTAQQRDVR